MKTIKDCVDTYQKYISVKLDKGFKLFARGYFAAQGYYVDCAELIDLIESTMACTYSIEQNPDHYSEFKIQWSVFQNGNEIACSLATDKDQAQRFIDLFIEGLQK